MGAMVPGGATVAGEPAPLTEARSATLIVDGPGVIAYKYRLNDGPWSDARAMDEPIDLSGLADGEYTVFTIGQNSAYVWQDEPEANASHSWTVGARPCRSCPTSGTVAR